MTGDGVDPPAADPIPRHPRSSRRARGDEELSEEQVALMHRLRMETRSKEAELGRLRSALEAVRAEAAEQGALIEELQAELEANVAEMERRMEAGTRAEAEVARLK